MLKNYFFYLIICAVLIIGFICGDVFLGREVNAKAIIVEKIFEPSKSVPRFLNGGKTLIIQTTPGKYFVVVLTRIGEKFKIECSEDFYGKQLEGNQVLIEKTMGFFSGNVVATRLK